MILMETNSIEAICKTLYTGESRSRRNGLVTSNVIDVRMIEETPKVQVYEVKSEITMLGNTEIKSIKFKVPQFNYANIKQTSINISIVNRCIKMYTDNSGKVVGASFKGLYINTPRKSVHINNVKYSIDEVTQAIKLINSGSEDTLKAVMEEEKIENIKEFYLRDTVVNKIKLLLDLDSFDNSILNENTWVTLLAIASGEYSESEMNEVTPYDIDYFDCDKGLVYHIRGEMRTLKNNFYSLLNQHGGIYASTIENSIKRYFLGNKAIINMVQYTQDTNPLSLFSQSKKMYFLDHKSMKKMRVNSPYMVGILDPIRTHESTKDVNVVHELTLACDFQQGESQIKVYDLEFNELTIGVTEYLNTAILDYDCADYHKKIIKKNKDGVYKYHKRTRALSSTSLDGIKYIQHQGALLSVSSSLLPMINRNDVTRDLLQSHYNTQTIPVKGSRKPIIHTSFNSYVYEKGNMNVKSNKEGKVVAISESGDEIKIQTGVSDSGKPIYSYESVQKYNQTKMHTANIYVPRVKVGDEVKEGDTLFEMNSFKDGELAMSVPLLTTYSTLRGKEVEDGYVLSTSAVKKFSHEKFLNIDLSFTTGNYKLFKDKLPKVGDRIEDENTDIIFYEENIVGKESRYLLGDEIENWVEKRVRLPKFSISGKVTSIKLSLNPKFSTSEDERTKRNYEIVKEWENEINESKKTFYDNPLYSDKFSLKDKDAKVDFNVTITCEYFNRMKPTDKLVNRSSNKGVLVDIVPDEEMPITQDGRRIECMMPALAMASRKNSFNITECKLTKLSEHLCKQLHDGKFDSVKSVIEKLYPMVSEENMNASYILNNFEDEGFLRIQIDPFDTFMTDEELDKVMLEAGIPDGGKEYLIDGVTGKRIRTPLLVGYNEYYRTHFIAEYKGSATPQIAYTNKMVQGVGNHRSEGQKWGEQEVHALLASGKEEFVAAATLKEQKKDIKIEADLNNILMRIRSTEVDE